MNRFDSARRAALAAVALAGLIVVAAGCSAPIAVRHDQDPTVDLRRYKTFAFYDAPEAGPATLIGRHLKQATREQLERQQYVYSEHSPDLRVALLLLVHEHPELRSTPGRGPYGYRGFSGGVESTLVRDGTLRIDLVDTRRNALVWQGVAEGRVDAEAMRNPGQAVRDVVAEIFARYGQATR
jgi:hypothetical protein